jgi:ribosomal protein S4
MIAIKKSRYKPLYKKFINLKKNVQFRKKLLKFKKLKWKKLIFYLLRFSKKRKKSCYYQFFDQNSYYIPKFNVYFTNKFKYNLHTKQRFSLFYGGLSKIYLKHLVKKKINSKFHFLECLEKRLDTVLYRSHFVLSVRTARQLISHKHVYINNEIITKKSYLLKKGDIISFSKRSHKLIEYFIGNSEIWPLPPKYLQINYTTFQIIVVDNFLFNNTSLNFPFKLDLTSITNYYLK